MGSGMMTTAVEDAEILEVLARKIENGESLNDYWPTWLRALAVEFAGRFSCRGRGDRGGDMTNWNNPYVRGSIQIRVTIRDTATGEERTYEEDAPDWKPDDYHPGGFSDYIWREGNYSCDCNRGNFFTAANGEESRDEECGHSRYRVRILDADTGALLYEDDDFAATPEDGETAE